MTQPNAQAMNPRTEQYALAITVLRSLYAAWRAACVYDENNNVYRNRRDELTEALKRLFSSGAYCHVSYQNDYVFFNGERLNYDHDFSFGRSLAARFAELNLGGISIDPEASTAQVDQALFALAQADRKSEDPFAILKSTWDSLGMSSVSITPLSMKDPSQFLDARKLGQKVDVETLRRRRAHALFQRSESVVEEFWERVRDRNSFDAGAMQRVVHQMIDEVANDEEILLEFASLKDFDEYTYYHSVNVAIYSIAVGMRLGMDRVRLAQLGIAALFHDIGKVKLPRDLITKPTAYDDDDWEQIKKHPALGALTLASLRPIDADTGVSMAGAFEHHLKMDLTGYPRLSRPRTIHLFSRIIAACDSFDAMTSGRVYQKESISPDEAMRRMLYKGHEWYDPLVLKAFVHVVGIFPVGTVVKLSDNSVGVVTRNDSTDLYAPEVLIVRDPQGTPMRKALCLRKKKDAAEPDRICIDEVLDAAKSGINVEDYIGVIYQPTESGGTTIPDSES